MAKENTSPEKSSKSEGKKKPNRIAKWFKDLKSEFKKVVWPTKQTVINNTAIVLGVVLASTIFVGVVNWGFLELMNLVYNR